MVYWNAEANKMETTDNEYKNHKTNLKCKRCGNFVYKEIHRRNPSFDYPYVCLNCDENMFSFEVE